MIDKIKALSIGLAVLAVFALFFLAVIAGGLFASIAMIAAIIACSYFIGSVILDVHRSNKQWKEKYQSNA
jgi:hypothetical protein